MIPSRKDIEQDGVVSAERLERVLKDIYGKLQSVGEDVVETGKGLVEALPGFFRKDASGRTKHVGRRPPPGAPSRVMKGTGEGISLRGPDRGGRVGPGSLASTREAYTPRVETRERGESVSARSGDEAAREAFTRSTSSSRGRGRTDITDIDLADAGRPRLPGATGDYLSADVYDRQATISIKPTRYGETVTEAQFLFKFDAASGANADMTTGLDLDTTVPATKDGATCTFVAEKSGRVFYDVRFRNETVGATQGMSRRWSKWLSGGETPSTTNTFYVDPSTTYIPTQYLDGDPPTNAPTLLDHYVLINTPDTTSAYVELYWYYDQGANIAGHFIIDITDGTAFYTWNVPAVEADQYYSVNIYRLHEDKPFTATITPAIDTAKGLKKGTPAGGAATDWAFTPNANYATQHAYEQVGELDWAGGNVWFDTEQYRCNLAPTNGVASVTMGTTFYPGANQCNVEVSGFSGYSQGANVATHIAIFLRRGGGSISLTTDHIVTLMNVASLPATFYFPYPVNALLGMTVGVAAVALTKDGYSFNGTFAQHSPSMASNVAIMDAGAITIVGSDVSHHAYVGDTSGSYNIYLRGNTILNAAKTLTLAASTSIIDCATNSGVLKIRYVVDSDNPPAAPTMVNYETIIFLCNHASVNRWFICFKGSSNIFYWEAGGTGGVDLF